MLFLWPEIIVSLLTPGSMGEYIESECDYGVVAITENLFFSKLPNYCFALNTV